MVEVILSCAQGLLLVVPIEPYVIVNPTGIGHMLDKCLTPYIFYTCLFFNMMFIYLKNIISIKVLDKNCFANEFCYLLIVLSCL